MLDHLSFLIDEHRDPPAHESPADHTAPKPRIIAHNDDITKPVPVLPHQLQNIRRCPICLRVYVGCADSGDPRVFSLQRVFRACRNFPPSLSPKVIPPRSRYRLTRYFFVEILRHFHQITDHETR